MGTAIVTASDRMITLGDFEYEPFQMKAGQITERVMLLIAGDYTVHSEALRLTNQQVRRNPTFTPHNVATI